MFEPFSKFQGFFYVPEVSFVPNFIGFIPSIVSNNEIMIQIKFLIF